MLQLSLIAIPLIKRETAFKQNADSVTDEQIALKSYGTYRVTPIKISSTTSLSDKHLAPSTKKVLHRDHYDDI